jgi:hypothetical protein
MVRPIEVEVNDAYCYAVLAKLRNGSCMFDKIEVKSYPSHLSRTTLNNNAPARPTSAMKSGGEPAAAERRAA